ncbi:hypothetical protein evm_010313 [Chilo suppressalis]|nr:hypothetical protein evm_010313 [Chilo suppressalis]
MSKRGRTLNSQARELVVKLHEYFERECQNGGALLPVTQVRDHVGEALGIGSRTVGKILSEKYGPSGSDSNVLHTPKKRKRTKPVTGIDDFDSHAIRNHIYGYFTRGEFPTLAKLCATLEDAGLYKGSIESLRTIITGIGFRYKKVDKRKIVMERHDIIMQRLTIQREVKQIINWDNVIFLDETWLNSNHSVPKTWTDDSEASCSKVPIGKGGRLIICHAGSASAGFVENSLLAFQSKSTKEYHEEMDAERFQEWFLNLLTNIPPNSTIIMDNAPYHSVQIDKAPTSANKKADLVAWLQRKGVEADMSLLKVEWLHLVKLHKPPRPTYAIDQLAEEHGHKVIRLPPYHCQYNAIELIWAQVKGYAARHNTKPPFSVKKMEGLLKEACAQVTQENWSKVVEKTKKIIMDDFDRDVKFDDFMDNQLVINLNDDDDEDDNDSSTCSE